METGGVVGGWAGGAGCGLCRERVRPGLVAPGLSRGCRGEVWRRGSGRCGVWGFEVEGRW